MVGTSAACAAYKEVRASRTLRLGARLGFLSLITWTQFAVSADAGMNEGIAAYKNGDFKRAAQEWRPLAEAGDADAQFKIAYLYATSKGLPFDPKLALRWAVAAANQGHAEAQYSLGAAYRLGYGVEKDYAEGLAWTRKAAAQNYPQALGSLGMFYALGEGVAKNELEAYKYFSLALNSPNLTSEERTVFKVNHEILHKQLSTQQRERVEMQIAQWTPAEVMSVVVHSPQYASREGPSERPAGGSGTTIPIGNPALFAAAINPISKAPAVDTAAIDPTPPASSPFGAIGSSVQIAPSLPPRVAAIGNVAQPPTSSPKATLRQQAHGFSPDIAQTHGIARPAEAAWRTASTAPALAPISNGSETIFLASLALPPEKPTLSEAPSRNMTVEAKGSTTPISPQEVARKPRPVSVPLDAELTGPKIQVASVAPGKDLTKLWGYLQKQHPELLSGLSPHIELAELGNRGTFQRLQAGPFASVSAARATCAQLKAADQDCIVVSQ